MPTCLNSFACLGSECPITCCQGWRIDIDGSTVQKYKKCKDEKWSNLFKNNINSPANKNLQYTIKLGEEGFGPFLTENSLCGIQKDLGEIYLGTVCKNFPRYYNRLPKNKLEKCLLLSCPEVIRLVLLEKEKISFTEIDEDLDIVGSIVNFSFDKTKKFSAEFNSLRSFSISILQNKYYYLQDKLIMLAYFFDNISNASTKLDINQTMKFFNELIASSLVNEFTQQIVVDKKAHFLKNLIKQMYSYTNVEEFHVYAQKIYTFSGLNFDTEAMFFGLYDEYYRLFLQQNSLILENYLVYAVYTSLFPFYSKNIWDDYIMLFLRYAVVNLFYLD